MLVYWRWAISELLVTALFPLLLLCALRMERANRRDVILLALVYASVWMTNAPGAVIATYSLAILLFALALLGRSSRPLFLGSVALGLGLALAAFYIVPAVWEQHWVQIKNVLGPWVFLPQNNFVTVSPPRNRRFIATAAVNIGLALALTGSVLFRRRQWPRAWTGLALLLAAAVFLMLPFSDSLWRSLPELRFVQFPWRWLLAMNAVAVLFFAAVCAHARRRTRIVTTATAVILFCVMLGVARITSGEPGNVRVWPERLPQADMAVPLNTSRCKPYLITAQAGQYSVRKVSQSPCRLRRFFAPGQFWPAQTCRARVHCGFRSLGIRPGRRRRMVPGWPCNVRMDYSRCRFVRGTIRFNYGSAGPPTAYLEISSRWLL